MKNFIKLVYLDFLQRARSYRYFIIVTITLYLAAGFVPAPDANYTTMSLGDIRPIYNSVWVGSLTAMISSLFIFMIGFFFFEGSISKDREAKMHLFLKPSIISDSKYLLLKAWSNSLLMLVMVVLIFSLSMIMFFVRRESGGIDIFDFIIPFLLIVIPTAIFTGHLAVFLEVITGRLRVLRIIAFIFCMALIVPFSQVGSEVSILNYADVTGMGITMTQLKAHILSEFGYEQKAISFGYQSYSNKAPLSLFELSKFEYPLLYILSRVLVILLSVFMVVFVSKIYSKAGYIDLKNFTIHSAQSEQPKASVKKRTNYLAPVKPKGIYLNLIPLIVSELRSFINIKKNSINILLLILWGVTAFIPMNVAHMYLLPAMLMISGKRISELGARSFQMGISNYSFAFSNSYFRQFISHFVAMFLWVLLLSLPVISRLVISGDNLGVMRLFAGILFILTAAQFLGTITRSGRLFETLLVLVTYLLINKVPWFDFVGAVSFAGSQQLFIFHLISSLLLFVAQYLMISRKNISLA